MNDQGLRARNLAYLRQNADLESDCLKLLTLEVADGGATHGKPLKAIGNGQGHPSPSFTARLNIGPPRPDGRDPYLTRFVRNILREVKNRDIHFLPDPTFSLSCCLLIAGIPTTDALTQQVKETRCIYLFVVIDDPALFQASLDHVDWALAGSMVEHHGGHLFLIPNANPQVIAGSVFETLSSTAPWALDGLSLSTFGATDLGRALAKTLGMLGYRALSTLGTFYDNCLMVRNAEHNLRQPGAFQYSNDLPNRPGLPAWVIGSGPSLDRDLAFLAEHQDKAVIISCGSALAPLMAKGIRPDFHVELENVDVGIVLHPVAAQNDLSQLTLVAPVTVDPAVMGIFERTIFTARQNLPVHPLYHLALHHQPVLGEPTVSNLALAFAREQNFPEICFFGTDMGSKDPVHDHAANTWHRDDSSDYRAPVYDRLVPANFGGDFYTSSGLFQALHALSLAVSHDPSGRRYFNCSDGAWIDGATPCRSGDLALSDTSTDKASTVDAMRSSFAPWDGTRMPSPWPGQAMIATIERQFVDVHALMRGISDFSDKSYIPAAGQIFRYAEGHVNPAPPGPESAANIMVRGTVGAHLLFMEYYMNRVTRPDDMTAVGKLCVPLLKQSMDYILADARDRIGGDKVQNVPEYDAIRTSPDERFPDPPGVPRNAPCPCGSGQRFKNCHGKRS